ncbi:MAG TPA: anti-sigma factor, partial [Burkholderiales bacterium]|nr:anti-sigma factor [Burkholderiales bacterium]
WRQLGFWRAFSVVSTAAVVVLAITTTLLGLRPPTVAPPGYIAVLEDSAAKPVLALRAYDKPWRMGAEPLGLPTPAPGKVLRLWAVEKNTGAAHGLIDIESEKPQLIALTEAHWKFIKGADKLVLSIEDAGAGQKVPTMVLFSGPCINLKGS